MSAVLATSIRVVNQAGREAGVFLQHPGKRLTDQVLGHPLAHGIARQIATKQILVACQVKPTLVSRDVGDVGNDKRRATSMALNPSSLACLTACSRNSLL